MKVATNPVHILLIIFYIVVKHSKPKINVKLLAHLQLHILVITTLFTIQIEQEFYNYVFFITSQFAWIDSNDENQSHVIFYLFN